MTETRREATIAATWLWLRQSVIGHNFCPFAQAALDADAIHIEYSDTDTLESALEVLLQQAQALLTRPSSHTTLVIFPEGFAHFEHYLDLLDYSNELLAQQGYEGQLQIASFHPDYCFEGEHPDAASHYTNRAPYPTLHLLQEDSLSQALARYPDPDAIPEQNIEKAHTLGSRQLGQELRSYQQRGESTDNG